MSGGFPQNHQTYFRNVIVGVSKEQFNIGLIAEILILYYRRHDRTKADVRLFQKVIVT